MYIRACVYAWCMCICVRVCAYIHASVFVAREGVVHVYTKYILRHSTCKQVHTHTYTHMHSCIHVIHTPDRIQICRQDPRTLETTFGIWREGGGGKRSCGAYEGTCTHISDVSGSSTPNGSVLIALRDRSSSLGMRRAGSQRLLPNRTCPPCAWECTCMCALCMRVILMRTRDLVYILTHTRTHTDEYTHHTLTHTHSHSRTRKH